MTEVTITEGQVWENKDSKHRLLVLDTSKYTALQKTILRDLKTREQFTMYNEEILEFYQLIE